MSKAYLLQVLLTQDQRSPSDVNVFFWLQLYIEIYLYIYVYRYDFCIYIIKYVYIKIIWCSQLTALAVRPFLFWGFLGQLCHAICLLQGCYLVLIKEMCTVVIVMKFFGFFFLNSCRLEGKWREKPFALLLSSVVL